MFGARLSDVMGLDATSIATALKQGGSKNHRHVRACLSRLMGVSNVEATISIRFLLSTNGSFIALAHTLTEFCSTIASAI
jgi:hypothetical protein